MLKELDAHDAVDLIKNLDSDEIAEVIKLSHVKGTPGLQDSCAFARWINAITGDHAEVTFSYIKIAYFDPEGYVLGYTWIDTPSCVQDFIMHFDEGYYPEIEVDKK